MRILILSMNYNQYSLGWSYQRAFESLGHDVSMIDPMDRLNKRWAWKNRYVRRFLERPVISAFNRKWLPELLREEADLVWVGKGAWAVPWLWKEFKQARPETQLVCYNGDNPLITYSRGGNRPWVTESIDCFDLFCTYNSRLVEPLLEAGAKKAVCIPFAWDSVIHPMHAYEDFQRDVLFVGNGDEHRARWLGDILSSPLARDWKTEVYGFWPSRTCRSIADVLNQKQVVGQDMAKLVASSRVTLNILRVQNEGSHNMRTFETPGCGGVLASQYSEEQAGFFPDGRAAIYFQTAAEAAEKISQLLSSEEKARNIRQCAAKLVQSETYRNRAEMLLASVMDSAAV